MTEASQSKSESSQDHAVTSPEQDPDEVSGIVTVRLDHDDEEDWESSLAEPVLITCLTAVELYERRKKLRKFVGMVLTGAVTLLFMAGVRTAARAHRARMQPHLTETSAPRSPAPAPPAARE